MLIGGRRLAGLLALWLGLLVAPGLCLGQGIELEHRPVSEIRIEGLKQVSEKLVRNQIRQTVGSPYDKKTVSDDITRITHLGRFATVEALVTPNPDGTVTLIYKLGEEPLLSDVQVVGNKAIKDQELLSLAGLKAGDPKDPFLIEAGIQAIKRAYVKKGYFVTEVRVDPDALKESDVLIYRIREGPRPRIRGIRFRGNTAFSSDQLASKIKSKTYILIFRKGEVNTDQLDQDATRVRDFYRDRGYLDAQVGRTIDLSPDQKSAVVVFLVQEGPRYTVANVVVEGNTIFTAREIIAAMPLKAGDIYSTDKLTKSKEAILDIYGRMGFLETTAEIHEIYRGGQPLVDVHVKIEEGNYYTVGKVSVKGNLSTKEEVIDQQLRGMDPGERYNRTTMDQTQKNLNQSPLFSDAKITLQGEPTEEVRDSLIEVKEKNTGSLSFGAGISSDAGVIGSVDLIQRNFDIAAPPESAGELFTGRSFRGAGQYFAINLQPGLTTSRYSVTFREPYLFGTNYFLDTSVSYYTRQWDQYDEQRIGGSVGLGQRFGDVWSAGVRLKAEQVDVRDIVNGSPLDIYQVGGASDVTSAGFFVTRSTVDDRFLPTRGSHWEVGASHIGALGGNYTYDEVSSDFRQYWTVDEDFFGRRTVLSFHNQVSQVLDGNAPFFDRLYAGGERSFRGFDVRGVSPRGLQASPTDIANPFPTPPEVAIVPGGKQVFVGPQGTDPVGGTFLFLNGLEYNFPVFQDVVRMVIFTDTGTVESEAGLGNYRVSVGMGLRIKIPFLTGQAPFALDVAYPVIKERNDNVQYFSFDLAVPF